MNDTVFANLYIEKIINEVTELTKGKLLLQTQIAWQEKQIQQMTELQNKLQQANNELLEKLKTKEKKASSKSVNEPVETF